jgi:large subunit ribosomal protein L16
MPKRVKFRKSQRGKIKGNAHRGNTVSYGDYGLQSLDSGWLSAQAIEAGRITASHAISGEGKLFIRVFPNKSITSIESIAKVALSKVAYKMPFRCRLVTRRPSIG